MLGNCWKVGVSRGVSVGRGWLAVGLADKGVGAIPVVCEIGDLIGILVISPPCSLWQAAIKTNNDIAYRLVIYTLIGCYYPA